jgi:hypothetical protein
MFLVRTLPPWHANIGKRIVKTPKALLCDSGIAAHLMGIDSVRLVHDRTLFGGLIEGFVAMELTKQIGWSKVTPAPYHFRTHEGDEVDLVLARPLGSPATDEADHEAARTASC